MARLACARKQDCRAEYEATIADYAEAIRINPANSEAYRNRGLAYNEMGNAQAARGVDPSAAFVNAMEDYDAVVRLNPSFWQALANKGLVLEALGKKDEAIGCYEQALEIAPNEPRLVERIKLLGR